MVATSRQGLWAALYEWVDPNRAELRSPAAIINALLGRDTEFYPRLRGAADTDAPETTPTSPDLIAALNTGFDAIDMSSLEIEDLKILRERYRESLNEVKAQTEYQDAKAARLLTIMSIFLAIAGMMFAKFVDFYPIGVQATQVQIGLVGIAYVAFATFLLLVLGGAVVVFHASRTRFRYENRPVKAGDSVKSRLFYIPISKSKPEAWAAQVASYVGEGAKKAGKVAEADFMRDMAKEAYLVACKANDKVRYMRPAQDLLWHAARVFVGWIVLVAVTVAITPRWKEPKSPPPPPPPSPAPIIQVLTQSPPTVVAPPPAGGVAKEGR